MTSESSDYQRLNVLFNQALELPEDQWDTFVASQCGGDSALHSRVMALLDAERRAPQSFLAQPALELTARQLFDKASSVTGSRLGPYVVGAQIGAGGMGTVYEAHDSRLDRKVAIKLLPPAFAGDPDRISRFRKEARAASLLNHPNIVSIYDAELDHGRYYIATEFVEGQTLRQLEESNPPDSKQILEIGIQICAALGAAHGAGIVHRDIKPENIMVRPDGFVKVLDFGLAKLREPLSGEQLASLETRPGNIAGTLQYLSPEQVAGKPAGPRSDIFSLGVVLYELTSGRRPFAGATDGAVFAAILHEAPPRLRDIVPAIDPEFDAVILRALEKDPDLRFQTIADLGSALKRLQRDSTPSGTGRTAAVLPPVRKPSPMLWPWLIAAVALAGCIWLFVSRSRPPAPLPISFQRLTNGDSEELYPALSPDGQQFIYASPKAGNWDIYLKRVGGETEINLTKDSLSDDIEPAFSPDGKLIAFHSSRDGGGLFVMEATGENPRRISKKGFYPSWSPDAKQIAYSECNFEVPSERHCYPSRLILLDLATETESPNRGGERWHSAVLVSARGPHRFLGAHRRWWRTANLHHRLPWPKAHADCRYLWQWNRLVPRMVGRRGLFVLHQRPRRDDECLAHRHRRKDGPSQG